MSSIGEPDPTSPGHAVGVVSGWHLLQIAVAVLALPLLPAVLWFLAIATWEMSDAADPMVSCLMVTLAQPERSPYLRFSVADCCRQTPSNRELSVVLDSGPARIQGGNQRAHWSLQRDDIQVIDLAGKYSPGRS